MRIFFAEKWDLIFFRVGKCQELGFNVFIFYLLFSIAFCGQSILCVVSRIAVVEKFSLGMC